MKCVLISIRPQWCELIANGKKTIEVRKNRPKLETPFKCYIYETKGKVETVNGEEYGYHYQEGRGAVIGEFTCDQIEEIAVAFSGGDGPMVAIGGNQVWYGGMVQHMSCLTAKDICKYIGGIGRRGFGWHISNLVIYDKPKVLADFLRPSGGCCNEGKCGGCKFFDKGNGYNVEDDCFADFDTDMYSIVTRAPQSWCYVEEVDE